MSKTKNPEEYIAETNQTSTGASTPMTADEIAAAEAKAAETAAAAADKAAAEKAAAEKAAAEKVAADKAAEKKAKQDAAAAKAAKDDSEANLRAIEDNTAKSVNSDPEVRVFITPKDGASRCEVCINGHWWRIKRGEWVPVPESVYLLLRESEKVLKENEELKGDAYATMML